MLYVFSVYSARCNKIFKNYEKIHFELNEYQK